MCLDEELVQSFSVRLSDGIGIVHPFALAVD